MITCKGMDLAGLSIFERERIGKRWCMDGWHDMAGYLILQAHMTSKDEVEVRRRE
jgi:hypothetical protein